jgi:hypothetical protein
LYYKNYNFVAAEAVVKPVISFPVAYQRVCYKNCTMADSEKGIMEKKYNPVSF